jgi:hypothetical protein
MIDPTCRFTTRRPPIPVVRQRFESRHSCHVKADAAKAASEAKLALEPVSVFISRATQKLYVRRNTHKRLPDGGEVFDATIEVPVTIRDPNKPIGTHVFSAVARMNGGLRWTAVTIDGGDGVKAALDRITVPQDVLDRIAPTALPRSSLIISDEPLHQEANYRTEFVIALNNQPQGGIITRSPSPDVRVGFWSGWGFNNTPARGARTIGTTISAHRAGGEDAACRERAAWHAGNAQWRSALFPAERIGGLASAFICCAPFLLGNIPPQNTHIARFLCWNRREPP